MTNEEKILEMLAGMQTDMTGIKSDIAGMKSDIVGMKSDIVGMKSDIVGMKSDIVGIKSDMAGMQTDIVGIKSDMASMKEKLEEVDKRSERTQVLLETEYHDKLQLLFDGHELIKEKLDALAPKNRVEALEDEVVVLKSAYRLLAQDVAELKKAQ